ncbi:hypothetical protein UAY_01448 [Enterococcus moraviensis ATCC BAA-383]|uniref:Cyclase n=1 Tax=Enterococcus moraviensis ATCC BAA-383 TaxID=1158609 RepID=R2QV10_9ENTE|nr:cyclase family protein [Enterococcus moraviensis]EOI00345.1 hypothetical protein UAY_01448 [Enterococcus moraviensis ATCC BAA-383]EOT73426.1 hypothetical protein I586_00419 [Enterococcus moraviensis ATCC BAA-383]OJG68985.1 hypothetical protein RV09_GL000384 [Enterococcus moraviensis]
MNTLDAMNYLKERKWIDLSHEIHEEIPRFNAFNASREKTLFQIKEDGFFAKEYTLPTQYSTHIDAPIHFAQGKRYLHQLELKELVLPLYVIHKEEDVELNNDYCITKKDILVFEQEFGPLPEDSFVAFSSGWSSRWESLEDYYNQDEKGLAHTPGWSLEALKYLSEVRNVTAIGHETLDTDSAADVRKNKGLLGEYYWLKQNKYQVEVMCNLAQLPPVGSIIITSFPNILNAPGFPVRTFAIVPD